MSDVKLLGPHLATPQDWESILTCVNRCLVGESMQPSLADTHPHCVHSGPAHLGRYQVIRDGDRVVGCLCVIEQRVLVDGGELRVAGLGQVATLPEYRGHGLMSRLLESAILTMTAEHFALSDLGGDRLRYGRYGWETTGRQWQFNLTPRSIGGWQAPGGVQVQRYEGDKRHLDAIIAIHEREPRRVHRTADQYDRLTRRLYKEVWLAMHDGHVDGYAVIDVQRRPQVVFEFGGSREAVHALLAQRAAAQMTDFTLWSPWSHPLNELFFDLASHWQVISPRMLRLCDLAATLRGFTRQMSRRLQALLPQTLAPVTLQVVETGEQASLLPDRVGVRVQEGAAGPTVVRLPRRAMTSLLFGPDAVERVASLPATAAWLGTVLPLDFMLWRNETV